MKRKIIALMSATIVLSCFVSCDSKKNVDTEGASHVAENLQQPLADIEHDEKDSAPKLLKQQEYNNVITDTQLENSEEQTLLDLFATLPEKMSPMERPEGYDNPVLSEHVIIETLLDAQRAKWLMGDFGIKEEHIIPRWEYYSKNWIYDGECPKDPNGYHVYYAPAVDTEEEFDEYFLNIFTEEALLFLKNQYEIVEFDGRLAVLSLDGRHSTMVDLKDSTVDEIIYNDDGTATVIITEYAIPGDNLGQYTYILSFSEKYGWRFHASL